jgi:hypothetical protein
VKHAPFLPDEPAGAAALHLHDISEVGAPPPVTVPRYTCAAVTHVSRRLITIALEVPLASYLPYE